MGVPINWGHPRLANIMRLHALNEGGGLIVREQRSGAAHAISGNPVWTDAEYGRGLDFDGTGDAVVTDDYITAIQKFSSLPVTR